MDDRTEYQKWADSLPGMPDKEQQTQESFTQEHAAPEGANIIEPSQLTVEDIEGPDKPPETPPPETPTEEPPAEPEKSYGEKALENESVVDKYVKDGLAFIKDAFDDRDYDEIREEVDAADVRRLDNQNVFNKTTSEAERAIMPVLTAPINSAAQVSKLVLDTAGSALGMRGDEPSPWSSEYEGAEFNLVGAKPVTEIGELGAALLGFMSNARVINAVIPGGPSVASKPGFIGKVQRKYRNFTVGAVADLVYTPGDGNLINMAQDTEFLGIGKIMKETGFLSALAHKDEDNEYIRRIRNMAEGGIMEHAVDGIDLTYKAFRKVFGDIFKPVMDARKISAKELPPQVTEAGEIIFQEITSLDDPQLARQAGEVLKELEELKLKVKGDKVAEQAIENAKIINKQLELDMSSGPRQTEMGDLLGDPVFKPIHTRRPGYEQRKAEDVANSGTKERQLYEPNERSGKSASYPVRGVTAQQAAQPEFGSALPRVSTDPIMTEALTKQLDADGGDTSDIVKQLLPEEFRPEMDEFRATNKRNTPEAKASIAKLRGDVRAGKDPIEALHMVAQEGGLPMPVIRTIWGDAAGKIILQDLAGQIREQVPLYHEIISKGGDATRQANMLLDKVKAVGKEVIRGRSIKGSALAALRSEDPIERLIRRVDDGEFDVPAVPDLKTEKKLGEYDRQWEEIRQGLITGDPKAVETMDVLSEALVLSDGNPEMVASFFANARQMGVQNFRTTMYNAYLSSVRTHERNILGTGFNVTAKPLLVAMGSMFTPHSAKSALAMYGSIFGGLSDSYAAARIQWAKTGDAQVARGYLMSKKNMGASVDNLSRLAKTPGEHAAAMLVRAQYYLLATPAGQYATRAMNSTDAAFRVISARQLAKYDYMMQIAKDNRPFNADELNVKIGEMVDADMEIINAKALELSKEDTFQNDLTGHMADIDRIIKNGGVVTSSILPFVKTPTNILAQTPQFMPILPRIAKHTDLGGMFMKEYHAVMKGDDEFKKALYKGREGAAYIIGVTATTMALNGVLSGSGHWDYGERQLDELAVPRHSVLIMGEWYSHRFLGPISTVLSMYADAAYVYNNTHRYDDYSEYWGQAAYSIAGALFEQSWLKGLVDSIGYIEELTNGRRTANIGELPDAALAATLSTFTKYGGALRDFNNYLVPGAREYNSNMDRWMAETFPYVKAFLGEEKISPLSGKPIISDGDARTNILTPFSRKDINESQAVDYLIKYGVDYSLELNDHYNGVKLSSTSKKEINKIIANPGNGKLGLEAKLVSWFESEGFKKMHKEWVDSPSPKEGMKWYTDTIKQIADLRRYAVTQYSLRVSDDASQLKQRIDLKRAEQAAAAAGKAQTRQLFYNQLLELNNP
tara:strand:+ start:22070 stop:26167 length:4098 start_codon:yes stop_codon:yes gene_type:complete